MTRDSFWMEDPVLRSAMLGLEMALWGILNKSLGVPVHALLEGKLCDEIGTYSNAWYFGAREPHEFAAAAAIPLALGYRALKFDPFGHAAFAQTDHELRHGVAVVATVWEAVGLGVRLALDAHGRFGLLSALHLLKDGYRDRVVGYSINAALAGKVAIVRGNGTPSTQVGTTPFKREGGQRMTERGSLRHARENRDHNPRSGEQAAWTRRANSAPMSTAPPGGCGGRAPSASIARRRDAIAV